MAQYWALSSGNWSNVSNWLTGISPGEIAGSLPGPLDDVYANGRIITVDGNFQASSIRNISAANISTVGGYFALNDGVSLSAFVYGGANDVACLQFLSAFPATATLVGNLCAGDANNFVVRPIAARNVSTGNLIIRGNCIGGIKTDASADTDPANNGVIINDLSGTLTLVGNFSGDIGPLQTSSTNARTYIGINNRSTGRVILSGSLIGGPGWTCFGYRSTTGVIEVTGTVLGGRGRSSHGIYQTSGTGSVAASAFITGRLVGNFNQQFDEVGLYNEGDGHVRVIGEVIGGGGTSGSTGSQSNGLLTSTFGNGTVFISGSVSRPAQPYGVRIQSGSCTIIGNVNGLYTASGATTVSITGNITHIRNQGSGVTYNILGDLRNSIPVRVVHAILNDQNTAVFNIKGDVYGGVVADNAGFWGPGQVFIQGNVYGSGASSAAGQAGAQNGHGIVYAGVSPSTCTVLGSTVGGTGRDAHGVVAGLNTTTTGTVILCGDVKGGNKAGCFGLVAFTNSPGPVYAKKIIGVDGGKIEDNSIFFTYGAYSELSRASIFVEQLETGERGAPPVKGRVHLVPSINNAFFAKTNSSNLEPIRSANRRASYFTLNLFADLNNPNFAPLPKDVRSGIIYKSNQLTGTMIVPAPNFVQLGIPVDNTRGQVVLSPISFWNFSRNASLSAGSIGQRVRNALTTQAAGTIFASFNLSSS